jgi:hypothetical protein
MACARSRVSIRPTLRVHVCGRATQIDITHRFPELAELGQSMGGARAVIDGELVALADDGRPTSGACSPACTSIAPPMPASAPLKCP